MINICFHGIGVCDRERERGEARYWVAEERFSDILDVIQQHAQVRLSFDDGNATDLSIALPALRERQMAATFFVIAGRLDQPGSLGAADLGRLRSDGMVVGTHGWAHVPWRHLDVAQQHKEFVMARRVIAEASGAPVDQAALPLGRFDRKVLGSLRRCGYATIFSSDRLPTRPNAWLQGRYSVRSDDTPDSIRAILNRHLGIRDARDLAASLIKRLR